MTSLRWVTTVCKFFTGKKKKVKRGNYLPISMFLIAGRFTNNEIDSIMEYGEPFIKELKY